MNINDLFLAEEVLIIALSVFFILIIVGDILNYVFLKERKPTNRFQKIVALNLVYLLYGFSILNFILMICFVIVFYLKNKSDKLFLNNIEYDEKISNKKMVYLLFTLTSITLFIKFNIFNLVCFFVELIYFYIIIKNNTDLSDKIQFLLSKKMYSKILDEVNTEKLSDDKLQILFDTTYKYNFNRAINMLSEKISKKILEEFVIFYYDEKIKFLSENMILKPIILNMVKMKKMNEELFYSEPSVDKLIIDDYCFERNSEVDKEYRSKYLLFLIEKVGNKCPICGKSDNGIELDHFFIPKKDGGNFIIVTKSGVVINNAMPMCTSCNRSKSDKKAIDFLHKEKYDELVCLQKEIKKELFG